MHVERGHAAFGKHSKFSTMHYRKCNFVLVDIQVGLLLTFLASMKAKVHVCLYIRFWMFTREKLAFFKYPFSRSPLRSPDLKVSILNMHFHHLLVNRRPKQ